MRVERLCFIALHNIIIILGGAVVPTNTVEVSICANVLNAPTLILSLSLAETRGGKIEKRHNSYYNTWA